jgi:hypothetical protein
MKGSEERAHPFSDAANASELRVSNRVRKWLLGYLVIPVVL